MKAPALLLRLQFVLLHVYLLGMVGMLVGAFWMQVAHSEMPCPLCMAQRMALTLAAIGDRKSVV